MEAQQQAGEHGAETVTQRVRRRTGGVPDDYNYFDSSAEDANRNFSELRDTLSVGALPVPRERFRPSLSGGVAAGEIGPDQHVTRQLGVPDAVRDEVIAEERRRNPNAATESADNIYTSQLYAMLEGRESIDTISARLRIEPRRLQDYVRNNPELFDEVDDHLARTGPARGPDGAGEIAGAEPGATGPSGDDVGGEGAGDVRRRIAADLRDAVGELEDSASVSPRGREAVADIRARIRDLEESADDSPQSIIDDARSVRETVDLARANLRGPVNASLLRDLDQAAESGVAVAESYRATGGRVDLDPDPVDDPIDDVADRERDPLERERSRPRGAAIEPVREDIETLELDDESRLGDLAERPPSVVRRAIARNLSESLEAAEEYFAEQDRAPRDADVAALNGFRTQIERLRENRGVGDRDSEDPEVQAALLVNDLRAMEQRVNTIRNAAHSTTPDAFDDFFGDVEESADQARVYSETGTFGDELPAASVGRGGADAIRRADQDRELRRTLSVGDDESFSIDAVRHVTGLDTLQINNIIDREGTRRDTLDQDLTGADLRAVLLRERSVIGTGRVSQEVDDIREADRQIAAGELRVRDERIDVRFRGEAPTPQIRRTITAREQREREEFERDNPQMARSRRMFGETRSEQDARVQAMLDRLMERDNDADGTGDGDGPDDGAGAPREIEFAPRSGGRSDAANISEAFRASRARTITGTAQAALDNSVARIELRGEDIPAQLRVQLDLRGEDDDVARVYAFRDQSVFAHTVPAEGEPMKRAALSKGNLHRALFVRALRDNNIAVPEATAPARVSAGDALSQAVAERVPGGDAGEAGGEAPESGQAGGGDAFTRSRAVLVERVLALYAQNRDTREIAQETFLGDEAEVLRIIDDHPDRDRIELVQAQRRRLQEASENRPDGLTGRPMGTTAADRAEQLAASRAGLSNVDIADAYDQHPNTITSNLELAAEEEVRRRNARDGGAARAVADADRDRDGVHDAIEAGTDETADLAEDAARDAGRIRDALRAAADDAPPGALRGVAAVNNQLDRTNLAELTLTQADEDELDEAQRDEARADQYIGRLRGLSITAQMAANESDDAARALDPVVASINGAVERAQEIHGDAANRHRERNGLPPLEEGAPMMAGESRLGREAGAGEPVASEQGTARRRRPSMSDLLAQDDASPRDSDPAAPASAAQQQAEMTRRAEAAASRVLGDDPPAPAAGPDPMDDDDARRRRRQEQQTLQNPADLLNQGPPDPTTPADPDPIDPDPTGGDPARDPAADIEPDESEPGSGGRRGRLYVDSPGQATMPLRDALVDAREGADAEADDAIDNVLSAVNRVAVPRVPAAERPAAIIRQLEEVRGAVDREVENNPAVADRLDGVVDAIDDVQADLADYADYDEDELERARGRRDPAPTPAAADIGAGLVAAGALAGAASAGPAAVGEVSAPAGPDGFAGRRQRFLDRMQNAADAAADEVADDYGEDSEQYQEVSRIRERLDRLAENPDAIADGDDLAAEAQRVVTELDPYAEDAGALGDLYQEALQLSEETASGSPAPAPSQPTGRATGSRTLDDVISDEPTATVPVAATGAASGADLADAVVGEGDPPARRRRPRISELLEQDDGDGAAPAETVRRPSLEQDDRVQSMLDRVFGAQSERGPDGGRISGDEEVTRALGVSDEARDRVIARRQETDPDFDQEDANFHYLYGLVRRIDEGRSEDEIAEEFGISRERVADFVDRQPRVIDTGRQLIREGQSDPELDNEFRAARDPMDRDSIEQEPADRDPMDRDPEAMIERRLAGESEPRDGEPRDGEPPAGEPRDGEPPASEPRDGEPPLEIDGQEVDTGPGRAQEALDRIRAASAQAGESAAADRQPVDGKPLAGEPRDSEPLAGEPRDSEPAAPAREPEPGSPEDQARRAEAMIERRPAGESEPRDGEPRDGEPPAGEPRDGEPPASEPRDGEPPLEIDGQEVDTGPGRAQEALDRIRAASAQAGESAAADRQPVDGEPLAGEPRDSEPLAGEPRDSEPAAPAREPEPGSPEDQARRAEAMIERRPAGESEPRDGEPRDGEPPAGEPRDGEPPASEPRDGEPPLEIDGQEVDTGPGRAREALDRIRAASAQAGESAAADRQPVDGEPLAGEPRDSEPLAGEPRDSEPAAPAREPEPGSPEDQARRAEAMIERRPAGESEPRDGEPRDGEPPAGEPRDGPPASEPRDGEPPLETDRRWTPGRAAPGRRWTASAPPAPRPESPRQLTGSRLTANPLPANPVTASPLWKSTDRRWTPGRAAPRRRWTASAPPAPRPESPRQLTGSRLTANPWPASPVTANPWLANPVTANPQRRPGNPNPVLRRTGAEAGRTP